MVDPACVGHKPSRAWVRIDVCEFLLSFVVSALVARSSVTVGRLANVEMSVAVLSRLQPFFTLRPAA